MKNFVQKGDVVSFVAPSGGATSGLPVKVGALIVVPVFSAAQGEDCEGSTVGVYNVPKKSTDTPTQFQAAYWDAANKHVTTSADDGATPTPNPFPKVGVFMDALVTGTTTADIRFNGVSV